MYNIHTNIRRIISLFIFEYVYVYYLCNRLHLIKICLCCFLDIHLYSIKLSTIATHSSLIFSEVFPACFSCKNNFSLLHNPSGSDGKNIVDIPDARIADDLSNFMSSISIEFITKSL